jgi:exodeoxyribonuclease-5
VWKRLAYVAITRAENRLLWVTRNRLSRPSAALDTSDLSAIAPAPLALETQQEGEG